MERKYTVAVIIGILCIPFGLWGVFVENEVWYHDILMTTNSIGVSIICTAVYLAKKKGQTVSLIR